MQVSLSLNIMWEKLFNNQTGQQKEQVVRQAITRKTYEKKKILSW